MSVVDFTLRAKNEASGPVRTLTSDVKKSATAHDKLREAQIKNQAQMRAQAKAYWDNKNAAAKAAHQTKIHTSTLGKLNARLKEMRGKKGLIDEKDVVSLGKYNREIFSLEQRIRRINKVGLAPKSAPGRRSQFSRSMLGTHRGASFLSGILGRANIMASLGIGTAALVGKGIKTGANLQHDRALFENEFGSTSLMDSLRKQKGSLGGDTVADGSELARSGMGQRKVTSLLKKLADVSGGNTHKRSALAGIMAAINKEGKLTEDTLESLQKAGFNPLIEMSERTGKSITKLMGELQAGKITVADVTSSLNDATSAGGKFFGQMDNMADTTQGRLSKISSTIGNLFSNFSENAINAALDTALKPLDKLSDKGGFFQMLDGAIMGAQILKTLKIPGTSGLLSLFGDKGQQDKIDRIIAGGGKSPYRPGSDDWMKGGERQKDGTFKTASQLQKEYVDEQSRKASEQVNAVSGGGARNYTFNIAKFIETIENKFEAGSPAAAAEEFVQSLAKPMAELMASVSANTAR